MELVSDFADDNDGVGIFVGHFLLEKRLVEIRIELFVKRIDLFETVSLEDLIQLIFGHCESFEKAFQMRILVVELFFWHSFGGVHESVANFQQVLTEWWNAEDLCVVDLFCEPLPHVVAVG